MNSADPIPPAWQPFTFGGVGLFAHAPGGRVMGMVVGAAILLGAMIGWISFNLFIPRLDEAISRLPEQGASILQGRLVWPGTQVVSLTDGPFLGISVDPLSSQDLIRTADFQIILAPREAVVSSMFGYLPLPYPREMFATLNRQELEPWWGAWRIFLAMAVGVLIAAGLLGSWFLLALIYFTPLKLIGFYLDRAFTLGGAFKLALAALMPAAMLMGIAILLYSEQEISLTGLAFAFAFHFLLQWVYLVGGAIKAPALNQGQNNPFNDSIEEEEKPLLPRSKNPFEGDAAEPSTDEIDHREQAATFDSLRKAKVI